MLTSPTSSKKQSTRQTDISFRVSLNVQEQFALLMQVRGKRDGELFAELVHEALAKPLSNRVLRTLPPKVRLYILTEKSKQAERVCRAVVTELFVEDFADDIPGTF
jgi:hypothetical protein